MNNISSITNCKELNEDNNVLINIFDPAYFVPQSKKKRADHTKNGIPHSSWIIEGDDSDDKTWSCLLCSKTFATKSNLHIHNNIHSGERFTCDECDKCFTQKCNLKRHKTLHQGQRSFSCAICAKKFTQKANLQRHYVIHSGKKNFACDECGKKFIQKINLKKHLERHPVDGLPMVECVLDEEVSSGSS